MADYDDYDDEEGFLLTPKAKINFKAGDKFGHLTVIKFDKTMSRGKYFIFKCDCGVEKSIYYAHVTRGRTSSCGCKQKFNPDKYIGRQYGSWVVKEFVETKGRMHRFVLQCKCETTSNYSIENLKQGYIRESCGCTIERGTWARKSNEVVSVNSIISKYRISARRRNLEFALDKELFSSLIEQNCHYCGAEPGNTYKHDVEPYTKKYNGIDRVDNSKGYLPNNVVPCCKHCNWMKRDFNKDDFLSHIGRIYNYRNVK